MKLGIGSHVLDEAQLEISPEGVEFTHPETGEKMVAAPHMDKLTGPILAGLIMEIDPDLMYDIWAPSEWWSVAWDLEDVEDEILRLAADTYGRPFKDLDDLRIFLEERIRKHAVEVWVDEDLAADPFGFGDDEMKPSPYGWAGVQFVAAPMKVLG